MKLNRTLICILLVLGISGPKLSAQGFDVRKFSEPTKYGWDSPEAFKAARRNLLERNNLLEHYDQNKQTVSRNLIKSMIVPGWGHFSCKKYTKGQIILGLEIVLLGVSLYYYDRAMASYDKYKKAEYIVDINQYYNDAKTPYFYSQGFFALGALVWLYSLYDTINVTEQYNQELWERIFFNYKKNSLEVGFQPISLRF